MEPVSQFLVEFSVRQAVPLSGPAVLQTTRTDLLSHRPKRGSLDPATRPEGRRMAPDKVQKAKQKRLQLVDATTDSIPRRPYRALV